MVSQAIEVLSTVALIAMHSSFCVGVLESCLLTLTFTESLVSERLRERERGNVWSCLKATVVLPHLSWTPPTPRWP